MRQRRVAEADQQGVDTVRMVLDRNALKEHGSIDAVQDREVALDRGGTACPDPVGKFLPGSAVGRDEAIGQVGVQNGPERLDAEKAERCIVAGEEHAVPGHTNQAARLAFEQLTEVRGVGRRRWRPSCRRYKRSAQTQIIHMTSENYT